MSKITFANIEDAKHLHTQGDHLIQRQNTIVRRVRHKPPKFYAKHPSKQKWHRTEKRSQINVLARQIADRFHSLSTAQHSNWEIYSAYFPQFKNAYQAFYANNMRLRRANHPSFSWVDDISSPPETVENPTGICVQFITVSASFCVSWTTPVCVSLFIQCFEWIPPGLRRSREQRWKFVKAAYSLDASLQVPLTFLDTGRQAVLALRAENLRGEISGYAVPGTFTKKTQAQGRYGYAYYGYAFYGEN